MNLARKWIIRWFVPAALQRDNSTLQQAVRAIVFGLALLMWWPVFTPAYTLLGSPTAGHFISLAAIAALATMASLRITHSVMLTGNLLSAILFAVLVAVAFVTGGPVAPALWWLCAVPIIALVLCNVRWGLVWAILSCIAVAIFFVLSHFDIAQRNDIHAQNLIILQTVSIAGIVLCAFLLTATFKLGESAVQHDLESARDAAEQANRAKSMLLANMSHEIRTPMNAIIGMTDLVLDTEIDQEQREYLEIVQQSGQNLLVLIDDILDFSVIEARRFELKPSRFHLRESLKRTLRSLGALARKKGLDLACRFDPQIPASLIGDQNRLRQVIVNLISNAIKFTDEGEIFLDIRCDERTDTEARLQFTVADTGIGIPQHKQDVIFGVFEQAEMSSTRRHGGAGLGLAISSELVQLMGGEMGVDSQEDVGSTFHFTARFELAESQPEEALVPDKQFGEQNLVLVVDGSAHSRQLFEELFSRWDFRVITAMDGNDAGQRMRKVEENGDPIGLVIIDDHAKPDGGCSVAREVRYRNGKGCPIVVTRYVGDQPQTNSGWRALGIDSFLLKPVMPDELHRKVREVLKISDLNEQRTPPSGAIKELPQLPPLRILLVEDSLVNQRLMAALIRKHGHEVITANNGREGLDALATGEFDVVLMDIQMPVLDGIHAVKAIREREQSSGSHLPVIALTAHALVGDKERFLRAGMDDYLSKPVQTKELLKTIAETLARLDAPGTHRRERDAEERPSEEG